MELYQDPAEHERLTKQFEECKKLMTVVATQQQALGSLRVHLLEKLYVLRMALAEHSQDDIESTRDEHRVGSPIYKWAAIAGRELNQIQRILVDEGVSLAANLPEGTIKETDFIQHYRAKNRATVADNVLTVAAVKARVKAFKKERNCKVTRHSIRLVAVKADQKLDDVSYYSGYTVSRLSKLTETELKDALAKAIKEGAAALHIRINWNTRYSSEEITDEKPIWLTTDEKLSAAYTFNRL